MSRTEVVVELRFMVNAESEQEAVEFIREQLSMVNLARLATTISINAGVEGEPPKTVSPAIITEPTPTPETDPKEELAPAIEPEKPEEPEPAKKRKGKK